MTTSSQTHIQHFLWRAGFGAHPQFIEQWTQKSIVELVNYTFEEAKTVHYLQTVTPKVVQQLNKLTDKKERRKQGKQLVKQLNLEWLGQMGQGSGFLREKMSLFWHNHFASSHKNPLFVQQQINTIKTHALGNFGDLLHAMAKDAVMLDFLNNTQNKKSSPNENFARELLELFTLGIGNYTEQDIKEAARAFTGWKHNREGNFKFVARQHDDGEKLFMGESGNWSGEHIVNIILKNPQTARFITRKLYRYFVHEQVDEERVQQLADYFHFNNYDISSLLYAIFTPGWFYEPQNIGQIIKSPIVLLAGLQRTLQLTLGKPAILLQFQKLLGQVLLDPPNVAGWAGGKSWIDSSTLLIRLRLPDVLLFGTDLPVQAKKSGDVNATFIGGRKLKQANIQLNWQPLVDSFATNTKEQTANQMIMTLLQVPISPTLITQNTHSPEPTEDIKTMLHHLLSLPEYQVC